MSPVEIAILSGAAFCTSALTAVVGAGGGTALIAIMLQVMSPAAAIPVHGAVQLASNTTRVWLLWQHMSWPIIFRFAAALPLGAWLGLALFQGLPTAVIQIMIGCFVLISNVKCSNWSGMVAVGFAATTLLRRTRRHKSPRY